MVSFQSRAYFVSIRAIFDYLIYFGNVDLVKPPKSAKILYCCAEDTWDLYSIPEFGLAEYKYVRCNKCTYTMVAFKDACNRLRKIHEDYGSNFRSLNISDIIKDVIQACTPVEPTESVCILNFPSTLYGIYYPPLHEKYTLLRIIDSDTEHYIRLETFYSIFQERTSECVLSKALLPKMDRKHTILPARVGSLILRVSGVYPVTHVPAKDEQWSWHQVSLQYPQASAVVNNCTVLDVLTQYKPVFGPHPNIEYDKKLEAMHILVQMDAFSDKMPASFYVIVVDNKICMG